MNRYLCCLLVLLLLVWGYSGVAASELTVEEIIDRVDETMSAATRESILEMTIVSARGEKRERQLKLYSKSGEFEAGLVVFLSPGDVRGSSFLTLDQNGDDDMWLYLPAIGSVRRIASHARGGSFMGTDFSYEDMGMLGAADYRGRYASELEGQTEFEGRECYVIESVPTDEEIEYSRLKMWVCKTEFVPLKIEFFDADGELKKVMHNTEIVVIDGYPTPHQIEMRNVQQGTKTVLRMSDVSYDLELPDNMFTTRYMQRAAD